MTEKSKELKLAPTFKYDSGVWHLVRMQDLKKDDVFKNWNSAYEDIPNYKDGNPVDFQKLRQFICTSDPYLMDSELRNGQPIKGVWDVECEECKIEQVKRQE